MSKVIDTVSQLVTPILDEMELEFVDVEYVKEGKDWFLRVFIDKPGGIDIEECGSEKLDEVDPITHNYFLEVSSPGAERPLKKKQDFEKAIGKNVYIKTYEPLNGEKEFEGVLTEFDGNNISVEIKIKSRKTIVSIPYEKIANARLAVSFS